jgi:hypothetical protein
VQEVGVGTTKTLKSEVPVAVKGLAGVKAISAGGHHSLALLSGGASPNIGTTQLAVRLGAQMSSHGADSPSAGTWFRSNATGMSVERGAPLP